MVAEQEARAVVSHQHRQYKKSQHRFLLAIVTGSCTHASTTVEVLKHSTCSLTLHNLLELVQQTIATDPEALSAP